MGKLTGFVFLAFALIFALPFAVASNPTGSATGGSGAIAPSSVIYTTVGGEFKFNEYANPSTGYNWVVTVDDPKVVSYNGYKEAGCQTQATTSDGITAVSVGSGCNYTYYFKAIAQGRTNVTMKYMRYWDSNSIVQSKQVVVVVSASNQSATPVVDCNYYWWFDNSHSYCQQGRFCGAFMYLGSRTFANESDCKAAVPKPNSSVCDSAAAAYSYCCADGVICKKVCRNGTYAEERGESADCKKTIVTPRPIVTGTPNVTAVPIGGPTVEINMQKGWNLFSVPLTSPTLSKTSCSRAVTWYYSPETGSYSQVTLKYVATGKSFWFYSTEDCAATYAAPMAYRAQDFKAELKAGWNMVGAPVGEMVKSGGCQQVQTDNGTVDRCTTTATYPAVKIADYKGTCNITAAYSFSTPANNWVNADSLAAKTGYFVKVSEACRMYAPDMTATIPPLPQ